MGWQGEAPPFRGFFSLSWPFKKGPAMNKGCAVDLGRRWEFVWHGSQSERSLMKTMKIPRKRVTAPTNRQRVPRRDTSAPAPTIELVPALLKIQSILVPIDFSDTSVKALRYAVRMAEQFGGTITLLNVVEPVATPDF